MNLIKFMLVLIVFGTSNFANAQIRVESQADALRRQIKIAQLKRQLEDARNGRPITNYNEQKSSAPHQTFVAEIHKCSNNGYHNTSYEHYCFDMYFRKDGTVYWNRRRFEKRRYNDELSGTYYLQEAERNRYDLYITWGNGYQMEGKVTYSSNNRRMEIHLENHVFDAK